MQKCRTPVPDCPLLQAMLSGKIPTPFAKPAADRTCSCAAEILPAKDAPPLVGFVTARCLQTAGSRVSTADLAAAVARWYRETTPGEKPPVPTELGRQLKELCPNVRTRRNHVVGLFYENLALRPGEPE